MVEYELVKKVEETGNPHGSKNSLSKIQLVKEVLEGNKMCHYFEDSGDISEVSDESFRWYNMIVKLCEPAGIIMSKYNYEYLSIQRELDKAYGTGKIYSLYMNYIYDVERYAKLSLDFMSKYCWTRPSVLIKYNEDTDDYTLLGYELTLYAHEDKARGREYVGINTYKNIFFGLFDRESHESGIPIDNTYYSAGIEKIKEDLCWYLKNNVGFDYKTGDTIPKSVVREKHIFANLVEIYCNMHL